MRFAKYHGLGNSYLVVRRSDVPADAGPFARLMCDPQRGIGADGVLIDCSDAALAVRIFNPDGSEAEKSGNGLRIFARWLFDEGRVGGEPFEVATAGGTAGCRVLDSGARAQIDMGRVTFWSGDIPVLGARREVLDEAFPPGDDALAGLRFSAASIGNPHCVVLPPVVDPAVARALGPRIETLPIFPRRTNVQFAAVLDRARIRIEIWERGAGYTLSSGSSSCAVAAVCLRLGLTDPNVTVLTPGGPLAVALSPACDARLTGPVTFVARGEYTYPARE